MGEYVNAFHSTGRPARSANLTLINESPMLLLKDNMPVAVIRLLRRAQGMYATLGNRVQSRGCSEAVPKML